MILTFWQNDQTILRAENFKEAYYKYLNTTYIFYMELLYFSYFNAESFGSNRNCVVILIFSKTMQPIHIKFGSKIKF